MTRHLDELELSELIDARPLPADVVAHAGQCSDCRLRAETLRAMRAEAALERVRTYDTPDPWPLVAALTVHRTAVRREVLRRLRVPLFLWSLTAFLLGVVATEAVRELSRAIAEVSVRAVRP